MSYDHNYYDDGATSYGVSGYRESATMSPHTQITGKLRCPPLQWQALLHQALRCETLLKRYVTCYDVNDTRVVDLAARNTTT